MMINMIAHQWRQPLSAISGAIIGFKLQLITKRVDLSTPQDREYYLKSTIAKYDDINGYVQFLSTTIDDFRNFFKIDKCKESVVLSALIVDTLKIAEATLNSRNIAIVTNYHDSCQVEVYRNELMQVILNLLKNCEDNFIDKSIENPTINISIYKENDRNILSIKDNGGGFSEDILSNIFDPYFSTKHEKSGTGLGLYMSKIIVEEHHNADLLVNNINNGVEFNIVFKSNLA